MSTVTPARTSRSLLPGFARGYSPMQIGIAGMLAVLVVIGSFVVLRTVTAPTYAVLYSNLSQEDAGAVVDKLTSQGVAYELQSGGSAILVPAEQVDTLRLSLATEGLPETSTVGYELLDSQALTTSSFREQVNYQRALEGELSRTLMSMDGVTAASVRLVMPEERLFASDTRPATAAVQLTTAHTLTEDQVNAVTHLVASSVPDLKPSDVTVTDSTGALLSGGDASGGGAATNKLQAQVEAQLTASADTMLAQVLGPDQAVVRVSAVIARADQTQQSEVFDPTRMAIGSQTATDENYTSTTSKPVGGLVVANPNPVAAANPAESSSTTYTSQSSATENLVSRTITETKTPPGDVSRLTVAVAISDKAALTADQVTQLVSNAVGLNTARGDTIVVTQVPFTEPVATPVAEQPTPLLNGNLPSILGAALLVIIAGFLLLRMRPKRVPLPAADLAAAAAEVPAHADARPARTAADRLLEQVDASPQEAAGVLRGWLAEDATQGR